MSRTFADSIAALLLAGLAWALTPELPAAARAITALLLGPLPVAMIAQGRLAEEVPEHVSRHALYVSSWASLWLLMGVTLAAAAASGFGLADLALLPPPAPALLAWTALLVAGGLALLYLWRALGMRESALLRHLIPGTGRERAHFVVVSISAGVCEEIIFRGFLIHALHLATGSLAFAVLLSSALFGVVHGYQGAAGGVRAGLLGAMLALPVLAVGSILPSILAHALLDLIAGVWLADRLIASPGGSPGAETTKSVRNEEEKS